MPAIQGDQLRGHLENLVLAALRRGDAHGFEILKRLGAAGSGALQLKEGSLYPALYRLEAEGLVKAAWEPGETKRRGPRRRVYRLTAKGRKRLEQSRHEWNRFVEVIGGILGSFDMNQLMTHIERIVRPIAAMQSRKLRMRTELLNHLQATLEEELQHSPGNEPAATERAMQRLGDPAELAKDLQQTVPILERLLLAKLPISSRLNHLEQRMAMLPGQRGPMALGHKLILVPLAWLLTCVTIPLFISQVTQGVEANPNWHPAHRGLFLVGDLLALAILYFSSLRLVFSTAASDTHFNWPGTCKLAALIFSVQIGLACIQTFAIVSRLPSATEIAICVTSALLLLAISIITARRISVLRRPYDPWLTLNIAG